MAGILVESTWIGARANAFVLGLGINVLRGSVPPADQVLFPATSLEAELGRPVDRVELLHDALSSLITWRFKLGSDEFLKAWEAALAFRGEQIRLAKENEQPVIGELLGLQSDGSLQMRANDKILTVQIGEIHLRPSL